MAKSLISRRKGLLLQMGYKQPQQHNNNTTARLTKITGHESKLGECFLPLQYFSQRLDAILVHKREYAS